MKYEKPVCECGGELFIVEERIHEIAVQITKTGKISGKVKMHNRDRGLAGANWLECNCGKFYDLDFDEKGRIARGDIRS